MKKINVLHIHPKGGIGGTEQYINYLLLSLPKHKFNIYACFLLEGGKSAEELKKEGIPVSILWMRNGFDIIRGLGLFKLIRNNHIDILHSHSDNILARFLGVLSGVPIQINTDHGPTINATKIKSYRRVLGSRFMVRFTDKYIAISKIMEKTLMKVYKVPKNKIEIVYNGIEERQNFTNNKILKQEMGIQEDYIVVICVARLVEQKKHRLLLQIASQVLKKEPKVIFLLVGDGELRGELEKYSKVLNINNNVKFVGFRKDIDDLLSIANIYIQTSEWEAFSVSLLEAMRAKLPIVGFDTDGVNEAVVNNLTGFLVPYKDIETFSKCLLELIRDLDKRISMGAEAYKLFEKKYTIQANSMRIIEIYKKLIKEKCVAV